nr:hypothetical protein [Tanacetum cinerariifolium]
SLRSSSTTSYSSEASSPNSYSSGSITPQNHHSGTSISEGCSNSKHLLGKIKVLEAAVKMHMHPEQHTHSNLYQLSKIDASFNSKNEAWEYSLDIDDLDLHLTPNVRSSNSTHVKPSPYTRNPVTIITGLLGVVHVSSSTRVEPSTSNLNPVRIIPCPAGLVQQAKLLKEKVFILDLDGALTSTQQYMDKVVEDVGDDDDFKSAAWVSATNYVNTFGGTVTGSLGDVNNFLKNGKLELVVGIVKSCSPNMLNDLNVTMKDFSGTIPGTIHHKVIGKGGYGKDIIVGAAMILTNYVNKMDLSDIEVPRVFVTCRNIDDWTEKCILLHFMLGQQLELTENSTDYNKAKDLILFRRRVFSSDLDGRPIRGKDVLLLIESDVFKRLDDNDAVSLCCVGILDDPTNETEMKSYSIEGFAWAFKTWIFESFRAATDDYYTRYRHHPRILSWSSKHKFYRNMLKPMLHGQLPVERLVPDETEARSRWGYQQMKEKNADMYQKMTRFMEDMTRVPEANTTPIIADQHFGVSDISGF